MKIFNKKFAFTLAEVMITLSLIGAIATLTLSTVGASIQQRARLAQFRTAYSKMENAIRSIILDEEKIHNCYLCPPDNYKTRHALNMSGCSAKTDQCTDFTKLFLANLGAVHFCENSPVDEGCIPANYPKAPESECFQTYESGKAYVLDNSMILFTEGDLTLFALDVNGRKGPNKWGQDIFAFSLYATESKKVNNKDIVMNMGILPPTACQPVGSSAGRTTEQMMKAAVNYEEPQE